MASDTQPECGCEELPEEGECVRVLLIDDDEDDRFLTAERLKEIPGSPYTLDWTLHYADGVEAICGGTHDVFLLDYRLGEKTGIDLLREAHARGCAGPVILLTGQGKSRTDAEALEAGADDYLEKDALTPELLDRAIRYSLAKHRAALELEKKVQERTEELARANAALRDADRRKDEFLATLAHELRNPLAPIRNALELVRLSGNDPDSVQRQCERMERQVAQLQRLVEDLLDVARIASGKLRLSPESLTLQEVIETALDATRAQIEKAKLTLNLEIPADAIAMNCDRVRLAQAITNLLHNATKFTEPGGQIWLTVSTSAGQITITVRDSGVGIPPEVLPELFTMFTQVERTLNRSQTGLGIGLGLVRRLVEMHGGTVSVHSDGVGTGSAFTITLPHAA